MSDVPVSDPTVPSLRDLTRVFGRIGVLSFGGPAAQIALMHRELVEERPWLTEKQFLGALSFCMLLPGPEAMQLATYAGWRLRGTAGGLIAGGLFVAPGALVIFALALLYAQFGAVAFVQDMFLGIKAAVIAIVVQALLKVAGKALHGGLHWALALGAFVALFAFALPFPIVIALAASLGALTAAVQDQPRPTPPTHGTTLRVIAVGMTLWAAPILIAVALDQHLLVQIGLFFSKLAVVTFGGAYAVLAYMTQEVVQVQGWLTTGQMMDALGLAETTPGPLILVTEFVGALAGFSAGGWPLALGAAAITLWVTFVPCFLWIFAGAPYIEWITHQPRLQGALSGITAAVVGVIANLSLWFAIHVFFAQVTIHHQAPFHLTLPVPETLDLRASVLAILAAVALLWVRLGLPTVLAGAAFAGLALGAFF